MNRPLMSLLAIAVALSACKRDAPETVAPTPTVDVVAGVEMIHFDSKQGTFSCLGPASWVARDEKEGLSESVTFVGPRDTKTMGSSYITILSYPGSSKQWTDAQKYAESFWEIDPQHKQPALEKRKIGGNTIIFLHQERPFYKPHSSKASYMLRYDYALIPVKGGFFAIEHRAPLNAYKVTLPVFEAVMRSFKPKL